MYLAVPAGSAAVKRFFSFSGRAGRPVCFWNRFIEPVQLSNRFIGTGSIFEPVFI